MRIKHLRWGPVIIDNEDVHIEENVRLFTEDLVGSSENSYRQEIPMTTGREHPWIEAPKHRTPSPTETHFVLRPKIGTAVIRTDQVRDA